MNRFMAIAGQTTNVKIIRFIGAAENQRQNMVESDFAFGQFTLTQIANRAVTQDDRVAVDFSASGFDSFHSSFLYLTSSAAILLPPLAILFSKFFAVPFSIGEASWALLSTSKSRWKQRSFGVFQDAVTWIASASRKVLKLSHFWKCCYWFFDVAIFANLRFWWCYTRPPHSHIIALGGGLS